VSACKEFRNVRFLSKSVPSLAPKITPLTPAQQELVDQKLIKKEEKNE
jgi:hypothetical protein